MFKAYFLDGQRGRLFCTDIVQEAQPARQFLILPPFAEEMNKSRHVLAALVRSLGDAGHSVLLPDLYGTGDSEGDFGSASIDVWRADIMMLIEHLAGQGSVSLIGLRCGALLAADIACRRAVDSLTLIHPIADGRQQLNQLLRLRLASGLTTDSQKESTADLRQKLADGQPLEIAGYWLSAEMASGLESLALATMQFEDLQRIAWIELVAAAERPLMPVSQRIVDQWQQAGLDVDSTTVVCDQFWATQEIAQCPAVVEAVMRHTV